MKLIATGLIGALLSLFGTVEAALAQCAPAACPGAYAPASPAYAFAPQGYARAEAAPYAGQAYGYAPQGYGYGYGYGYGAQPCPVCQPAYVPPPAPPPCGWYAPCAAPIVYDQPGLHLQEGGFGGGVGETESAYVAGGGGGSSQGLQGFGDISSFNGRMEAYAQARSQANASATATATATASSWSWSGGAGHWRGGWRGHNGGHDCGCKPPPPPCGACGHRH